MRVTGGMLRGRRIATPRGDLTRPTSERVREALFSILGAPGDGTAALDLFCGAGTLAIEALSRGVERAVLVDSGRPARRIAEKNLADLELSDRAEVIAATAASAIRLLNKRTDRSGTPPRFDWVFIDPPYASDLAAQALEALGDGALLTPAATLVVEHDKRRPPAAEVGSLVRTDLRRYGDTELSLYRLREAQGEDPEEP